MLKWVGYILYVVNSFLERDYLSDENIKGDYKEFVMSLYNTYGNDIIILGRGT